jgi:8-oxo-dGTP pyrophosphatase MutT (NUDIX family)
MVQRSPTSPFTLAETLPALADREPAPADDAPAGPKLVMQSGVLAYRHAEDGEILVLLVSKKRSKRWGIPKGKVEAELSFSENAVKEAYEEAGVKGRVSPHSVGMFRATKRSRSRQKLRLLEVWVYLLEVTDCLPSWPEKGERKVKWLPCHAAAAELREPVLVDLCRRLAQH